MPREYSRWLEPLVPNKFVDLPKEWIGKGPFGFLWVKDGSVEVGYDGDDMKVFSLRMKPGFIAVRETELKPATSSTDKKTLADHWRD